MQAVDDMGILGHPGICIHRSLALAGKFLTNVKNNLEQYFLTNTGDLSGKPSHRYTSVRVFLEQNVSCLVTYLVHKGERTIY